MKLRVLSAIGLLALGGSPVVASTHVSVGVRIGVPAPIIVRQAPPRRVSEAVVISPGPGFVWVAGHYSWRENQWVWVPGAWVTPPQPGAVWVEGRWEPQSQSWTEGHWEVAAPRVVTAPPPGPVVVIRTAPPPLRHEHRGHRPGRDFVWVSGFWSYDGGRYLWVPGHWTRPPHGHHRWSAPRWEHRNGTYVFIEGRWN